MKKLTIRDIAKLSGVSASTVSRVLDDNPKISRSTRENVLKVISENNYHRQASARNLARQKTNAIGVFIPQNDLCIYASSFFQQALYGISTTLSQYGYDVLISSGNPTEIDSIDRLISSSRIDGIILLRSVVGDKSIEFLQNKNFPFVLIGTCLEDYKIYSVDNDNQSASYELATHIYNMGKRRIAFIGGAPNAVFIINRLKGYKKCLEEHRLDFNENYIKLGSSKENHGYNSMKELILLTEKPDAVMVMDESVCVGVIKAINEYNLRIPEDIAVACFNESEYTKLTKPSLTTISLDFYKLGAIAASKLMMLLINEKVNYGCTFVDYKLTVRESTANR